MAPSPSSTPSPPSRHLSPHSTVRASLAIIEVGSARRHCTDDAHGGRKPRTRGVPRTTELANAYETATGHSPNSSSGTCRLWERGLGVAAGGCRRARSTSWTACARPAAAWSPPADRRVSTASPSGLTSMLSPQAQCRQVSRASSCAARCGIRSSCTGRSVRCGRGGAAGRAPSRTCCHAARYRSTSGLISVCTWWRSWVAHVSRLSAATRSRRASRRPRNPTASKRRWAARRSRSVASSRSCSAC